MANNLIGARLKALREQQNLSQEDMAKLFGFKDRQTVSAIETGERRLSADELLLAVNKFGAPLEYFTDPFRLEGEGRFSWRQTGVGPERLSAYEQVAGRWVAAFRVLSAHLARTDPFFRLSLKLHRYSSFEDAMSAGERLATEFKLGDVPAMRLPDAMEEELGILVLMVDAWEGISGAACRLPELDAVLVNRHEVAGRRNFDLAHELFHVLTWDVMPPEHAEEATEFSNNRVEQLANNFASALLMPARIVNRFAAWAELTGGGLLAQIKTAAEELQVTASALKWRLVAMGKLTLAAAKALSDASLRGKPGARAKGGLPALFSRKFMEVLGHALEAGNLSVRRAAGLLDISVDQMAELFKAHSVPSPVEL